MGQGPVGGMSMPQGASGYGTMSSQPGMPLASGQYYSPPPGIGPGGMSTGQGASGFGRLPGFNPMQTSQIPGAMAPPLSGGVPYVAGKPFTPEMFEARQALNQKDMIRKRRVNEKFAKIARGY